MNILDNSGRYPLILACSTNRNNEILSALINLTPDINLEAKFGETPLSYCCNMRNYEGIKLLLSSGAKVDEDLYYYADEKCTEIINEHLKLKTG